MIVGHPLVPILNAAAFAVLGAKPEATLVPAAIAYLLLVLFAAALGRRLGGAPAFGLAAGAATALSAPVLYYASEGLSEIPFVAAELGALVLLWDLPRRSRRATAAFALGLVLGIAHLARPVMVPLIPAWLLGVALASATGSRLRAVTCALAGFLVFAVPLALYKFVAAGNPLADVAKYNLLTWLAPEFTPERIHRMLHPPAPGPYLATHLAAVFAKIAHFGPAMAWSAITQAGGVIAVLALVYLGWTGRGPEARPLRITLIVLAATFVVIVTLSLPNERYLFPLLPIWIALGVAAAGQLTARLRLSPSITAVVLVALVALGPGLGTLRLWRNAGPRGISDRGGFSEHEWRSLASGVAQRLPRQAIVATDIGPQLAWYTEHAAVLIPNTPDELEEIERSVPLDAIVLTNHWLIGTPGSEEWRSLFFARRALAGWTRADSVEAGRMRAIVFTRDRR